MTWNESNLIERFTRSCRFSTKLTELNLIVRDFFLQQQFTGSFLLVPIDSYWFLLVLIGSF